MEILDARGLECPLPVVKTKELLKEIDKVKVLVDNEIAIENLTKFAGVRHYQIVTGDDGDGFYAIIAKEGIDEELDFNEKSGDVVVISSKTMGSNEELFKEYLTAEKINLLKVSKIEELEGMECFAKTRSRDKFHPCRISVISDDEIKVLFTQDKVRAVTPGQGVVLYDENYEVIGSGFIK